jgi:hypothetical protein
MTRKTIEGIYRTIVTRFPEDSIVNMVGIYKANNMLAPGVMSAVYKEEHNDDGIEVVKSIRTLCWILEKQPSLKQLKKIVDIWTEMMNDDKV